MSTKSSELAPVGGRWPRGDPADLLDSERYLVQRRLGAGAFGVVYEAYDRRRDDLVALKILTETDPEALYRFKCGFRSLAEIVHDHLIDLYQLSSDGHVWFFSMELVRNGVDFLSFVRNGVGPVTGAGSARARRLRPVDPFRLRRALRQLADGLECLHSLGQLHCDLKPSNVLVDRSGRLRLLDFGLAEDLSPLETRGSDRADPHSGRPMVWGSVAYSAPEASPLDDRAAVWSPASDWYSVGVMVYEALTGARPMGGQRRPGAVVSGVPEEIDSLVADLLRQDPESRPTGREVQERLGHSPKNRPRVVGDPPLVGRHRELEALREACEATRGGRGLTILVHGVSGVGKTALVERFLADLDRAGARGGDTPRPVILRGRCHRQETVPYKTFDSLIDALSRYLLRLPETSVRELMPRQSSALLRLFPVLERVEPVTANRDDDLAPDPQQRRRLAFRALRELMGRLASRAPLVLFVDDLQWGDADSAALFPELLRVPGPPLLFIGCYRSEDADGSPLLQALERSRSAGLLPVESWSELRVAELDNDDVRELASWFLLDTPEGADREEMADIMVRDAGGNPFFVGVMARALAAREHDSTSWHGEMSLERVLRQQVANLDAAPRRLLDVVAVADRPLTRGLAARAASLDPHDRISLKVLEHERLIRSQPGSAEPRVEMYHDRIGEAVVAGMAPDRKRQVHRRLASALERSGQADPAALALHFQGTHEVERAAHYAEAAADSASAQLAFDRAARLLRLALELRTEESGTASLLVRLGDALRHGGRGAEAAEEYIRAVQCGASGVVELQRLAAEQLLISGHIERGLQVLRHVFRTQNLSFSRGRRRVSLWSRLERWRLLRPIRRKGLVFDRRDETELPRDELLRVDTLWSAAVGLRGVDPVRASEFQARHLSLAFRSDEPKRIARALALEVAYSAAGGGRTRRRTDRLLAAATSLAEELGDAYALGRTALAAAIASCGRGQWAKATTLADQAKTLLRERCTGVSWELATTHHFYLQGLGARGAWRQVAERIPDLLEEVQGRQDLYAENLLQTWCARARLAADRPAEAREDVRAAQEGWSRTTFHYQHVHALLVQGEIALYDAEPNTWRDLDARWQAVVGNRVMAMQLQGIQLLTLRGRTALVAARAASGRSERTSFLRALVRDVRRIERERQPWGDGLALMLRAGLALARDRPDQALWLYGEAEAKLGLTDMAAHREAARWRQGELLAGDTGAELAVEARDRMDRMGIANPERMCGALAPRW